LVSAFLKGVRRRGAELESELVEMKPVPVAFGDCLFDPSARLLYRRGKEVDLSPKAYALLAALLEKRPAAFSQSELRDLLWPDTVVAYTSLPRVVTEVRRAIGDEHRTPRFVRTVRGFGYAFAIAAEEASLAAPVCTLVWGDREIVLSAGENLIGRTPDCRVRIGSSLVSRHHARIRLERDVAVIEDLDSKNGTAVNGAAIDGARTLNDGDRITIGAAALVFRAALESTSTETAGN
jgi:DNA-binding winged helix-turn-helix (wHTH) protein